MSSPIFRPSNGISSLGTASLGTSSDDAVRREAIDPTRSFTVRAPAGSGKTELLIQRYLALLGRVERPEAIVAITFTKKAAGEMLGRVMDALREANQDAPLDQPHKHQPHKQVTRDLARAALERDREMNWCLLEHAGRLRIQTIDSLCMSIAGEMPWLSRLGAMPSIEEDTRVLYREAARRTLEETAEEHGGALETVLEHLDNNAGNAQKLIATMLATREQWLELAHHSDDEDRAALEESLRQTIARRLRAADELIPPELREPWVKSARFSAANRDDAPILTGLSEWPDAEGEHLPVWQALADLLLTKDGWKKALNRNHGFLTHHKKEKAEAYALIERLQTNAALLPALLSLRKLPAAQYSDAQWHVLRSLLQTLRLAVAQLKMVFRENSVIDFAELSIAANHALGHADEPTDLAYRLDSRIEHLLIDEFQDTSRAQFDLLRKLTADWDGDGARTLFLVGDPMQSIYRFRQAEVGLFMAIEQTGLGALRPRALQLTTNHRSVPAIVERVNRLFADAFPQADEMETGAVRYSESRAETQMVSVGSAMQRSLFDPPEPETTPAVTCEFFIGERAAADEAAQAAFRREAQRVIERIAEARSANPQGSIGILVRARTHLPEIVAALKAVGLAYRAVEIDPLQERMIVRDLLSLTRALLHLADRIAWLSILRAPWCGLTLEDLEALVAQADETASGPSRRTIWECLQSARNLSDDGRARVERLRRVLTEAFAEQGRWTLRRWVERVWINLGGPAVIADDREAREDADAFFQLLEQEQHGADLPDLDRFAARVADMNAPPSSGDSQLHIMTIHKAKGLEFDTVILPGLGRATKTDDDPLVLFHEWSEDDTVERLMAPVHETAGEQDALYTYLKSLESQKSGFERQRQLYVAMTRAKKHLHLMGSILETKDGERRPDSRSMLADIWPGLTEEERAVVGGTENRETAEAVAAPRSLRRLPAEWAPPEMPKSLEWPNVSGAAMPHEPSFQWVGESLRHIGTVVHAFLQNLKPGELQVPDARIIRAALKHAGVSPHELGRASERVERSLRRTMESQRGRWILDFHQDVHSEYALAAVVEGEVVRGIVDRTFVDDGGTRWVVDFKTSAHEGAGLRRFLDEQFRRYRDQMERYAKILQPLGNPVRLGLYFPLLNEWQEWAAGEEPKR